jgi:hypothetical protein
MIALSDSAEEKVSAAQETAASRDERDAKLLEGIVLLAAASAELGMRLHERSERPRRANLANSGVIERTTGSFLSLSFFSPIRDTDMPWDLDIPLTTWKLALLARADTLVPSPTASNRFKAALARLIGVLAFDCQDAQDRVRESGGIELLVGLTKSNEEGVRASDLSRGIALLNLLVADPLPAPALYRDPRTRPVCNI